jgi:hypothetical protein
MYGGDFSQEEIQQLQNYGFTQDHINFFYSTETPFSLILERITALEPNVQGPLQQDTIDAIINDIFGNFFENIEPIPNDNASDISFGSDNSLHLTELNATDDSMIANTTLPDESLNLSDMSNTLSASENESINTSIGGKKNKRKTYRKKRSNGKKLKNKSKKQKGGTCYGTGVGANSYDPNFSIYNTRQLELFPYKPK